MYIWHLHEGILKNRQMSSVLFNMHVYRTQTTFPINIDNYLSVQCGPSHYSLSYFAGLGFLRHLPFQKNILISDRHS